VSRTDVLAKCELFRELSVEQLGVVEKMCSAQEFEAGAIICKQGRQQDHVYVIEEGAAVIVLEVGPLAQRQVQAASQYEVLGWSGMVDPKTCTATVKATQKIKLLAFNGEELCSLCLGHPEIGCRICRGMARVLGKRLRQAYVQLLGVTSQD
jgi:CRP-like cAMP-binding protein